MRVDGGVTPPSPVRIGRFRRDLETLIAEPVPRLALAVSGGADSLAMLLLAAAAYPGQVDAATVDHGLRAEAAAESALVGRLCAELRVPHTALRAPTTAAGQGVQAAARKARYKALAEWMAGKGLRHLLTAHHLDDQAETVLMRLLRGSGIAGLAGVRSSMPIPGDGDQFVCRPLLGWRRGELAGIVAAAGWDAVDDPSNRDERFDRSCIRRRLRESPWIEPAALARSAAALADADDALDQMAEQLYRSNIRQEGGAVTFDPHGIPAELRRRLVLRCIIAAGAGEPPRGEKLATLISRLERRGTATLAGVKCRGGPAWRFELAPPRSRPSA